VSLATVWRKSAVFADRLVKHPLHLPDSFPRNRETEISNPMTAICDATFTSSQLGANLVSKTRRDLAAPAIWLI
jgi:hypothetical protein